MEECMIIRGWVYHYDGREEKFRPGTPAPSLHWAYMLIDAYHHLCSFSIKWIDCEPMITVTKNAGKESDAAFRHILGFAKDNNLDITICERKCKDCDGHPECPSPSNKEN